MGNVQVQGSLSNLKAFRRFIFAGLNNEKPVIPDDLEVSAALQLAMQGSLKAIEAKGSLFPWISLMQINEAIEKLNRAVNLEPDNADIRFLRWIIQKKIPSFLGLSQNLAEDYYFLVQAFESGAFADDPDFHDYLATHMQEA